MTLIKKIFNMILILIGIAFLVALAGFAIMMIGHVSLFGYTYISLNHKIEAQTFNPIELKEINVETPNIDVRILNSSDATLTYGAYSIRVDMQGIVKDSIKKVSFINEESYYSNGVLNLKTTAPDGLLFKNNTILEIVLPKNLSAKTVKIVTNRNVNFGSSDFVVDNLEITASKKFLNSPISLGSNITINEKLTLNTNYGRIIVNSKINGDLKVNSLAGSVLVNTNVGGDVDITGSNPMVEIGSIPGKWRNKKDISSSDISNLKAVNVSGNLIIHELEGGGNVKVSGSVKNVSVTESPSVEFWGVNVSRLTCSDGSNNIRIFGMLGDGSLSSSTLNIGEGSLFINSCTNIINITAQKGDIYIADAQNNVNIESKNGSSTVHFNKDVSNKSVTITNDNHNIEVTNINGVANLTAKKGKVTATFLKVVGQNNIYAQRNIDVKVKDGSTFKLITKAKAGGVDVNMSPVMYTNWDGAVNEDGWKVKTNIINDNGAATDNELLLQMNGNDKITASLYA
jgi:hypothetical protein